MTTLNLGRFAGSGIGNVPERPDIGEFWRVPNRLNRTVRHEANCLSHRYGMTRCFPYQSDKLSRLALPSGLIERRPSCGIRDLAECEYPAPILPRRLAYNLTYLVRAPGIRFDPAPSFLLRYTQKSVGKEKTRKKAIGFAGGGAGRRDSGVRRVDVYHGTYETVGRIEKPGSSPGFFFTPNSGDR